MMLPVLKQCLQRPACCVPLLLAPCPQAPRLHCVSAVPQVGSAQETWNYKFEEVHIEWPARLARAIKESGKVERFIHLRCGSAGGCC